MIEIFELPFMQNALIASFLIGIICAILGVYIVLKKVVFFSASLAQISTAAMALAFLLGWNATATSLIVTFLIVVVFSIKPSWGKIPLDSILGIGYVAAFALGILFMAKSAIGIEELHHLLQGNILTISSQQIYILFIVFVITGLVHFIFRKELLFISFDPIMASTQGYNVQAWNLLLYFTIGLIISFGIRVSGVLLIFAMLVIPAVVSLLFVKNIKKVFFVAIFVNIISVFVGLYSSFQLDLPSGPTIVAVLLIPLIFGQLYKWVLGK